MTDKKYVDVSRLKDLATLKQLKLDEDAAARAAEAAGLYTEDPGVLRPWENVYSAAVFADFNLLDKNIDLESGVLADRYQVFFDEVDQSLIVVDAEQAEDGRLLEVDRIPIHGQKDEETNTTAVKNPLDLDVDPEQVAMLLDFIGSRRGRQIT